LGNLEIFWFFRRKAGQSSFTRILWEAGKSETIYRFARGFFCFALGELKLGEPKLPGSH